MGFKQSISQVRPVALGLNVQSSTYGQAIPVVFGRTKGQMYLIWAANLRQSGGGLSGSGGGLSGLSAPPNYVQNVDYLIGTNPIIAILQLFVQEGTQPQNYLMTFDKVTDSAGGTGPGYYTISDGSFYALLAVTTTNSYSVTFNDYGSTGPITLSGMYETPLWNMAQIGPDLVLNKYGGYNYVWTPATGATIYFPGANRFTFFPNLNFYYASINPPGTNLPKKYTAGSPLHNLNAVFEPELGDGPEYTGTDITSGQPLSNEQIIYPYYAGIGSAALNFGNAATAPNIRPEVYGSFGSYATGDADFADMVESIFKGSVQSGIGTSTPFSNFQHGLNCGSFPGCVQMLDIEYDAAATPANNALTYPRPNVAGNFLLVAVSSVTSAPPSISDTAGNTWAPVFGAGSGMNGFQLWYATAKAYTDPNGMGTTVKPLLPWIGLPGAQITICEIAGVDTIDAIVTNFSGNSVSVTTTGAFGSPEFMLAFAFYGTAASGNVTATPLWKQLFVNQFDTSTHIMESVVGVNYLMQTRVTTFPGTYSYTAPTIGTFPLAANASQVAILSFRNSQPVNYATKLGNIFGDILDRDTLNVVRNQDRAYGLYGSLLMDQQQKGSDWLKDLYDAMDAWPVWSGFALKSVARSEQSFAGNGAIYTSPTSSGPVANLQVYDFIADAGQPPVSVDRKAQFDIPNLMQATIPNRGSYYNDINISQPETSSVALLGPRKGQPKRMPMFQDPFIARMYLQIEVNRQNLLRNTYSFKLNGRWKLLEAGDLVTFPIAVTMPDSAQTTPYVPLPVRLTKVTENADFSLDCEAEPFVFGCHVPVPIAVPSNNQGMSPTGLSPGSVNTPVIFEPVPRLAGSGNLNELWIAVSAPSASYGGCYAMISTDGGNSYQAANAIGGSSGSGPYPSNVLLGSAITGVTTADWPAHLDPDTVDDLALDLTESNGALVSYQVADEDNFVYPCFVSGGVPASSVQGGAVGNYGVNSVAFTFTNPNASSDAIIVSFGLFSNTNTRTVSVADSRSNTYTQVCSTPIQAGPGVYYQAFCFVAFSIAAGANTVTISTSESVSGNLPAFECTVREYSGLTAVDSFATNSGNSSPSGISTGSLTTTAAGDMLYAFIYDGDNHNITFTPSTGFTFRDQANDGHVFGPSCDAAFDNQGVPVGGYSCTFTLSNGGDQHTHCGLVAFKSTASNSLIPYELMTYAVANLTSAFKYTLKATGGGTNHLRRGVFGAPLPAQGVDHPSGARFAFVGQGAPGILKLALDPLWIGKQLFFKFLSFNQFFGQPQSLSAATAYSYTPMGTSGSPGPNPGSYSQTPANALTNPTATTIHMAQVTVQFPSNSANYNARTFTISAPSSPTTYSVTIADPAYVGDSGTSTNLVATCSTSGSLAGVAGNTYIGSIVAEPGGGGTIVTPGGWPPEQLFLVNGT